MKQTTCKKCQNANAKDAKFCGYCGVPLSVENSKKGSSLSRRVILIGIAAAFIILLIFPIIYVNSSKPEDTPYQAVDPKHRSSYSLENPTTENGFEDMPSKDFESGAKAEIYFGKDIHDFEEIQEGTIAKHSFTFTNTGDAPLIITNASGSCGCTVPSWPKGPIAPGETGRIYVEFNSTNRLGEQRHQFSIKSNTHPDLKVLHIRALVKNSE